MYREYKTVGLCALRSTAIADDRAKPLKSSLKGFVNKELTTYLIDESARISVAMMSLDHETRVEAATIFYGENTFSFDWMNLLIPFFKDQTELAQRSVRSCRLNIEIAQWEKHTVFSSIEARRVAFASIKDIPHLSIRNLYVSINSDRLELYPEIKRNIMSWVRELSSNINDLDMFGINYRCALHAYQSHEWRRVFDAQERLWNLLAPKMLKKIGEDHTLDSLLERRLDGFVNDLKCIAEPLLTMCRR